MCFIARQQELLEQDQAALLAEMQELCEMMPMFNQTMILVHCMALSELSCSNLWPNHRI